MSTSHDHIRVGVARIPLDTATSWVQEYTDAAVNATSDKPYAYPAYDHYNGDAHDPDVITDADLLAPVLLNVQIKIRTFYALQAVRPHLEHALRSPVLGQPLATVADSDELDAAVRSLYEVLDDPAHEIWGIGGTTLSKVLHRKRPQSVVLHDRWVNACYAGEAAPLPVDKTRSWGDYMVLLTNAIRDDIATQPEAFNALRAAVTPPGELSEVRLLDIVAWKWKGGTSQDTESRQR